MNLLHKSHVPGKIRPQTVKKKLLKKETSRIE